MKKMYINGNWVDSPESIEVLAPYTGEVIDSVLLATPEQVETALAAAEKGAKIMAGMPAFERSEIVRKTGDLVDKHSEELARLIATEAGKPISESRGSVIRSAEILRISAFEGAQLRGEYLPLDANMGTKGKMGFVMRVPCEVVLAITPYN